MQEIEQLEKQESALQEALTMVKQTQEGETQDDDSAWEDVSECDGLVRKRVLQAGSGEVPEPHCVCLGESPYLWFTAI